LKSAFFEGVDQFERKFQAEGSNAHTTMHCWCQSSRVIVLSCGIEISAVHCYSAPVIEVRCIMINRSVCLSSVCVSVCPRAYLWNRWTKFYVQLPCGRGSVLFWRRCVTLGYVLTSGFMDNVAFGRNRPYAIAALCCSDVNECLVWLCLQLSRSTRVTDGQTYAQTYGVRRVCGTTTANTALA